MNKHAITQPAAEPEAATLKALLLDSVTLGKEGAPHETDNHLRFIRREDVRRPVFFVGTGTCGLGAGAGHTLKAIRNYLEQKHLDADVVEVGCVGLCVEEPLMDVQMPGRCRLSLKKMTADRIPDTLDRLLQDEIPADHVIGQYRNDALKSWDSVPFMHEHPFFAPQMRRVLVHCGLIDPESLEEYMAHGGYRALADTLRNVTPGELCDIVLESGLRGRGGGGFPAGRKWTLALEQAARHKYFVCNADEGDPGAFMDRAVIEGDPFRLLEGLTLAAYGIGADKAYIYIRAEYPLAIRRLKSAIRQARDYGLLGKNILKSGFDLDIIIKQGAGAFVCGEETALLHSIEGKRGMPRPRPPFPSESGLFDSPTVINNAETLANVPDIVLKGAGWFRSVGTENSKGTKVFAL
ncbi:hypothetical protein JW948_03155, partial [bacterium]|nr:hypothetical protein [bacterium]